MTENNPTKTSHTTDSSIKNRSARRCKVTGLFVGAVACLIVTGLYLHPLWLDSTPMTTVRLLLESRDSEVVPLARIFGSARLYCAIGPYDSFQSSRFHSYLANDVQQKLDEAVKHEFPDGQSDNQFILVGLDRNTVLFIYRSLYLDKKKEPSLEHVDAKDCVNADGHAVVSRSHRSIYIR